MLVTKSVALEYFKKLPISLRVPCLDPNYLEVDCCQYVDAKPIYFLYEEGDFFWLHQTIKRKIPEQYGEAYDLISPSGYGGPVSNNNSNVFLQNAWAYYHKYIYRSSILAEFVRFHPLIENNLFWHSKPQVNRQTIWLDLTVDDIKSQYLPRRRLSIENIIKSNKLEFKIEQDGKKFLKKFLPLYCKRMQQLDAQASYYFNDNYFNKLIKLDGIELCYALHNDDVIAASIFLKTGEIVEYYLSASNSDFKHLGASDFILHNMILKAKTEKHLKFHLGGGLSSDLKDPLFFYKKAYSKKRSTYYIATEIYNHELYSRIKKKFNVEDTKNILLFYR